jgi:translation initiation factor IF-2
VLINRGTLKVGDILVVGTQSGRVRAMLDDKGRQVKRRRRCRSKCWAWRRADGR